MACPGGGKFEAEVDALIREEDAAIVCVIVIGGKRGNGFSVAMQACNNEHQAKLTALLSTVLKSTAKQIDDSSTLEGGG